MTAVRREPLVPFHTGVVVDDLAAAVAAWSDATGRAWAPRLDAETRVRTPEGETVVPFRLAYARDGRLELVQRVPGTAWDRPGVHHTGCWSSDLAADAAALDARGWPVAASGIGPDGGPALFSFHRVPGGGFLELVDAALRAGMEAQWASGR